MGAAFTEPSLAASSLGSWADECEWADAALAAAEAQMGRRCPNESSGDNTAPAGDLLEEEDLEWVTALGAAIAPPPPRPWGTADWPPGRQGAPKSAQEPPPATGNQKSPGPVRGKGAVAPKAREAATPGATAGRKPRRSSSPQGPDDDQIQVVKVQKGGLTLPARVKEKQYDRDDQRREAIPILAGEGRMVVRRLAEGAHGMRKVIKFWKQKGMGHATVEAGWETVAAPLAGQSSGG